jgi:hypothetical protein
MRQISEEWWIGVDDTYRTRVEDGSLVIWRPERTIWINIWNDHAGKSRRERLERWIADRNPSSTDLFEHETPSLLSFGYLLEEPEEAGGERLGLYSYSVSEASTAQMVCYFDLKEDLNWALAVSRSLSSGRPEPGLDVEETVDRFGHLVLASAKVVGPGRDPVLFAYRETAANDGDSGWRFFHGDEDETFTADSRNLDLCPLSGFLDLDPALRMIINHPAGTAWERADEFVPWRSASLPGLEDASWRLN